MTPSPRQQAIYDEWLNTDSNILISAVAGSGKTSTLMELLALCKHKVLFVAFNKSIQTEIEQKIKDRNLLQGKAMTMHALGFLGIRQKYKTVKVESGKNFQLIDKLKKGKYKDKLKLIPWEFRLTLFYCLIDMLDMSRMYLTDDIKEIEKHMNNMDKFLYVSEDLPLYWEEMKKIRDESYEGENVVIDFIDMIYLPVAKQLYIPVRPYYLFVDECQDLGLYQHKLLELIMNQGDIHKWVAVGDEYQAIYSFAGSMSDSFDRFREKDNVKEMPLDVCYRCARDIVAKANEVYPIMSPFKRNNGIIKTISDINLIEDNSMVICRNTRPLIQLYFNLLFSGRSVVIKGEDILNRIQKFLKPYKDLTFDQAEREMGYVMWDLGGKEDEKSKYKLYLFQENYKTYELFKNNLSVTTKTVDSLITSIKGLFVDRENAITLCTIHKSKGLEADTVYILNEWMIPSIYAKGEEQLKQEKNLKYVARTRAKSALYFLNLD